MRFYVGLHMLAHVHRFERCMISRNVLRRRRADITPNEWIMDSGAFTEITTHGGYRDSPEVYAAEIDRWSRCGNLAAAVAQDYMCEPFVLERTGLSVAEHQRLTIERYDALCAAVTSGTYIMPVLQGYAPQEYADHIHQYADRLGIGQWVGVGSVCKRNANPESVSQVLQAIVAERPDLRLHGFGVKLTALAHPTVCARLHTADSMAWSFAARKDGRGSAANHWQEAMRYVERIDAVIARRRTQPRQLDLWDIAS